MKLNPTMYFACGVAALGSGWFEESSQDLIPFGPVIVQYLFVVPLAALDTAFGVPKRG